MIFCQDLWFSKDSRSAIGIDRVSTYCIVIIVLEYILYCTIENYATGWYQFFLFQTHFSFSCLRHNADASYRLPRIYAVRRRRKWPILAHHQTPDYGFLGAIFNV